VNWSDGIFLLLGVVPGVVKPTLETWMNFILPEDRAAVGGALETIRTTPGEFSLEFRIRRTDGSVRWLSSDGEVVVDDHGSPARIVGVNFDITEQKSAEDKATRLAEIIETTSDFVALAQMDGEVVYMNRAGRAMVGIPVQAPLSEYRHTDLCPKWVHEKTTSQWLPYALKHGSVTGEGALLRNDGKEVPVSFVMLVHRDSLGAPYLLSTISRDISDRFQAEQALTNSNALLRAALDAGKLGVWEWFIQENRVTWTDRLYEFHGLPKGTFGGRVEDFAQLVYPDDLPRVQASLEKALAVDSLYEIEFRTIRPDGELRWLFTRAEVFKDATGAPVRMVGITQDVTERKRAEVSLRQSEAAFRELAESMPQLVWVADSGGKVTYYNSRISEYAETWEGLTEGLLMEPFCHTADQAATRKAWIKARESGSEFQVEHRMKLADGTFRWHLSRAYPVKSAAGEVQKWYGTATEIDAQKRAQEVLEAAVAERTARLTETIGELEAFSYSIAHDMRAPLRAMRGFSGILCNEHASRLDKEAQDYLQRISRSAERLDLLIHDVLDYSKIVRGTFPAESVDTGKLMRDIIETYPNLQQDRAEVLLIDPLPMVLANTAALTQVFSNLLGNAVKFVAPGVKPRVLVRGEAAGELVRIWFEDNGIGMEPGSKEKIFRMFQRLNPANLYEGTGIGLAIVRKALERMGGRVGFESVPGQGSRFWVDLPRCAAG
jgi:PAS domain S-box-containing protein